MDLKAVRVIRIFNSGFIKVRVYIYPLLNVMPEMRHRFEKPIESNTLNLSTEVSKELNFRLVVSLITKGTS